MSLVGAQAFGIVGGQSAVPPISPSEKRIPFVAEKIDDHAFAALAAFLKSASGYDLQPSKRYIADTRLGRVAKIHGYADINTLTRALVAGAAEGMRRDVIEAMTTNETSFFRDTRPFDNLKRIVLPQLAQTKKSGKLSVLSAGAATGQEPYSIAIAIYDELTRHGLAGAAVLGIDIDSKVLAKATAGLYTQYEVQRGMPTPLLIKHFEQRHDGWQVKSHIRLIVTFRQFNLMSSASSLGVHDIIFCRNVLIYFDEPTRAQVLKGLVKQLAPGGYLFMGSAEQADRYCKDVVPVAGAYGLYRCA